MEEERDFRVFDGGREFRFRGVMLGFSSTRREDFDRWRDFTIYRTVGGKYILTDIGRSLIFHEDMCATVVKNPQLQPVPYASIAQEQVPCRECMPNYDDHLHDNSLVYPEQDNPRASVYDRPDDVIQALSRVDRVTGREHLNRPAREVLEAAAENDDLLHSVYYVVQID